MVAKKLSRKELDMKNFREWLNQDMRQQVRELLNGLEEEYEGVYDAAVRELKEGQALNNFTLYQQWIEGQVQLKLNRKVLNLALAPGDQEA